MAHCLEREFEAKAVFHLVFILEVLIEDHIDALIPVLYRIAKKRQRELIFQHNLLLSVACRV